MTKTQKWALAIGILLIIGIVCGYYFWYVPMQEAKAKAAAGAKTNNAGNDTVIRTINNDATSKAAA